MIQGQLFPGYTVNLDERTAQIGGSWIPGSGDPLQAHGQDMIALFFDHLRGKPSLTVLDIGANMGSFCLLAAFIPTMRVYAFEPVPNVFEILRANVEINPLGERVMLFGMALSDTIGAGEMHVPKNPRLSGLSYLDNRKPDMPCDLITVSVTTLDNFCANRYWDIAHIDAIKLDVEGIEARVLRGGEQTIRRDKPLILLEATNIDQTIPLLESWGYTCRNYGSDILATYEETR